MRLIVNGWRLNVRQGDELDVSYEGPFDKIEQRRVAPDGALLPHKVYTLSPQERARTVEGQAMAMEARA